MIAGDGSDQLKAILLGENQQSGAGKFALEPLPDRDKETALALTEQYYPGTFAPELLAEFAARCPPLLRYRAVRTTLTQVSWSNLRIAAFPGIHWSRSPLEALRFARTRIFPNRVALDELSIGTATQPALEQVGWYGISHFRRILRWTFARAPRAQTVISLQSALAASNASLNA